MSTKVELELARVAKLMESIGRCIAIYQRIEVLLKVLLPHIADPAAETDVQSMPDWRSLLDSKQTLGPASKAIFRTNELRKSTRLLSLSQTACRPTK